MKWLYFILLIPLLICCKGESEVTLEKDPLPVKTYALNKTSVNSYDFQSIEPFLQKKNDTVYVVNFWATWCAPCVAELPVFEKLSADYKQQKVKVLLVSLDMANEVENKLIPFMEKKNLQSKVIHLNDPDANSWINKVDSTWSGAIPATLIYGRGKRKFYEQSFESATLEKEVQPFLNIKS